MMEHSCAEVLRPPSNKMIVLMEDDKVKMSVDAGRLKERLLGGSLYPWRQGRPEDRIFIAISWG